MLNEEGKSEDKAAVKGFMKKMETKNKSQKTKKKKEERCF
jgi:hypothetical protein